MKFSCRTIRRHANRKSTHCWLIASLDSSAHTQCNSRCRKSRSKTRNARWKKVRAVKRCRDVYRPLNAFNFRPIRVHFITVKTTQSVPQLAKAARRARNICCHFFCCSSWRPLPSCHSPSDSSPWSPSRPCSSASSPWSCQESSDWRSFWNQNTTSSPMKSSPTHRITRTHTTRPTAPSDDQLTHRNWPSPRIRIKNRNKLFSHFHSNRMRPPFYLDTKRKLAFLVKNPTRSGKVSWEAQGAEMRVIPFEWLNREIDKHLCHCKHTQKTTGTHIENLSLSLPPRQLFKIKLNYLNYLFKKKR